MPEKITKLSKVLEKERITQRLLRRTMEKQLDGTGQRPVGIANINKIVNGNQTSAYEGTYVKILNAINELKTRKDDYEMDEIIGLD